MAFLKWYFDESEGEGRLFVGGCVMTDEAWLTLTTEWRQVNRQFGIKQFHASSCYNRVGEYAGWLTEKQIDYTKRLITVVNKHVRLILWCSIDYEENRLVAIDFPEIKIEPYEGCVLIIAHQYKKHFARLRTHSVAVYFEKGDGRDVRQHVRTEIVSVSPMAATRFHGVTFVPKDKGGVPLEVADLIAYERYKDYAGKKAGRVKRKSLVAIESGEPWRESTGSDLGESGLRQLYKKLSTKYPNGFGAKKC